MPGTGESSSDSVDLMKWPYLPLRIKVVSTGSPGSCAEWQFTGPDTGEEALGAGVAYFFGCSITPTRRCRRSEVSVTTA